MASELDLATDYETVAASQTSQVLGPAGGIGDIIANMIINVTAVNATSVVTIQDGADSAIALTTSTTPIGLYNLKLNMRSRTGAWKVTTLATATVIAIGKFK